MTLDELLTELCGRITEDLETPGRYLDPDDDYMADRSDKLRDLRGLLRGLLRPDGHNGR